MNETPPAAPNPERLHTPVARLLRPLVRLFIRSGLTFPSVAELLRELYVNVAEHDFALPDKEQTDSRVSLLTGVHRKEVSRLRGAGAPVGAAPAAVSRTSAIIARWLAAPEYLDADGHPRALARAAEPGGRASFDDLVASVTRDVRPRAVLDEWLDRKIAAIDAEGRVALLQDAFVPPQGADEQLYYLGRNLHDHAAAAVANVLDGPRFLERAVHYGGLSREVSVELEAKSREIALRALQEANREAYLSCENDPGGGSRWIMGVYVYREDAAATAGTAKPKEAAKPRRERRNAGGEDS